METIKNALEQPKKKRGRPLKILKAGIASILQTKECPIPDWKSFNINDIANINSLGSQIITLKDVKIDENGDKYILVKGKKYYEYNENSPKDSMYILKNNSLFIGDRFEGLTYWSGVSFRYTTKRGDELEFYQNKTNYAGGIMHLKQIYKSNTYINSRVITTVFRNGRKVNITEDLVKRYLSGECSNAVKDLIEFTMKTNPELFVYIESLKE